MYIVSTLSIIFHPNPLEMLFRGTAGMFSGYLPDISSFSIIKEHTIPKGKNDKTLITHFSL